MNVWRQEEEIHFGDQKYCNVCRREIEIHEYLEIGDRNREMYGDRRFIRKYVCVYVHKDTTKNT